jgi:pimeloyl-ACP methyl ester carboxylesterase
MIDDLDRFDSGRTHVMTPTGPVSYVDTGGPARPVALFIHGVGTSSYLWRKVIERVRDDRRCVALDLPLHGETPGRAGQDYSLRGLARFVADFCDALGLADIDLVANDTGGAVAQIFAANRPELLRSFTLTNCETHDNVPPLAFLPAVLLARLGLFARSAPRLLKDPRRARRRLFGSGYQDVEQLPIEVFRRWQEPLFGNRERANEFQRWLASLHKRDLLAVEDDLRRLRVPTLVVWGTDDRFFDRKWASWLRDTIPGVREVVEVPGGRLFFPDERPDDLAEPLRRHWHEAATKPA